MGEHGLPAKIDRFLYVVDPAQFLVVGPHRVWVQKRARYIQLPKGDFWMAHYLRAFDRSPEVQAVNPIKRWRFPPCDNENEKITFLNHEGKRCSALLYDDVAAETYREVM